MPKEPNLKSIQGVEIFSVGTWNGDEYTERDLDEMVKAFQATSETMRPPLKLGHSDNQTILQQDGWPAAGWIGNVYRKGSKLLADFIDIPNKIYELLERGAYKKVSSEIFWNAEFDGSKYSRMLAAVALLGADTPAVSNLKDILSLYTTLSVDLIKSYATEGHGLMIKEYTFNSKDHCIEGVQKMEKSQSELKLEQDLQSQKTKADELENELKSYKSNVETKEAELSELKKFKAEAEAKLAESAVEKIVSDLQSEKLISPSMKPYVKALLSEDKKEYSVSLKEKEEKKFTKAELLKEILKLHSAKDSVNTAEGSEDNRVEGVNDQQALDQEIKDYAREKKVSYSAAYKAVLKNKKAS